MVLYDPHRKWAPRGICRQEDSKLFFADAGQPNRRPSKVTKRVWDQAKEICAMCPVQAECRRDTLGEEYGVFGGLDQYERYQMRRALSKAVKTWPRERQLAWGEEMQTLRQTGMNWMAIQIRTGLPCAAGEFLLGVWKEHLATLPADTPAVVDLPLPEPAETEKRPFPDKAGRRHAWIRHRGIVADAWYRGETPDGRWIYVTTESGRGQVHKWVSRDDVHLYRPQAVVILNYRARPDDEQEHDLTA
jgi:hypothetical protein